MTVPVGFKLPNCGGVLCEPAWARPETIRNLAGKAEALGYSSVWMQDHLLTPKELQHLGPVWFHEPLVTASDLLARTERIAVGVATFVLPLREPVLLARQLSTINALHPGRFIAGFGTGRYESEFAAVNAVWADRGRLADEYLRIVTALFSDDRATVTGDFRGVTEAVLDPKPESGAMPIWIGGNVHAAHRRAAAFGDGWVSAALSVEEASAQVSRINEALAESARGLREFRIALSLTLARARRNDVGPHHHRHKHVVAGGTDQIVDQLSAYLAVGVTDFLIAFDSESLDDVERSMEWFSSDVWPRLNAALDREVATD